LEQWAPYNKAQISIPRISQHVATYNLYSFTPAGLAAKDLSDALRVEDPRVDAKAQIERIGDARFT
jgi:hypothetical protein